MTTTYAANAGTGTSRTTGIATQTLNTLCHFAGSEIDNSVNKDEALDLVVTITFGTAPVAGAPLSVYILYAMDGTNYEDGIPGTNTGAAAASPAPQPTALERVIGVQAVNTAQKVTLKNIPLAPYKFKIVLYNGTAQNCTNLCTVLAYGRKSEIVG